MGTNGAARQRLHAERKKNGIICVKCVCVEQDVIAVLRVGGFLDTDEPTRAQLSAALSKWTYHEMTRQGHALYDGLD
jgi:hypothetical protein